MSLRPSQLPAVSVVIPTYLRPGWIGRAVRSFARERVLPAEVIAVARDTDTATHEAVRALQGEGLPFAVRLAFVSEPGFMPPVARGFEIAEHPVVLVMDDDAEAGERMLERLLSHYSDPSVGGAGGKCVSVDPETEEVIPMPSTDRVGYISPLGKFVGDMYKVPTFRSPVDTSFLMGGCMSFRREVARRLEFDMRLNRNVAYGYEVDIGLQVRNMGYRLVFDPLAYIRHYTAPRVETGMRRPDDREAAYWAAFNHTRVALRRLAPAKCAAVLARELIVGTRRQPGLLPMLSPGVARRLGFEVSIAPAAMRGRFRALRETAGDAVRGPRQASGVE